MENQVNNLKNELTLGKELAKQLLQRNPSSSNETRELLISKILNSYDRALHMLNASNNNASLLQSSHVNTGGITGGGLMMMMSEESPRSPSTSPRSEDSDHHRNRDFNTNHRNKSMERPKKRKGMPRWTKHVQVSPGNGLEGPLDDEYSWRKYGQKDILGAKYPRGYYRCTRRHVQGCMATKQVQRTDDDQTIFEITYRGTHTCNQNPNLKPPPPPPPPPPTSTAVNQDTLTGNHHHQKPINSPPQQSQRHEESLLRIFQAGLKVRTQNLEDQDHIFDHPVDFCTATSACGGFGSFPVVFGGSSSSMVMDDNDFGRDPCPSLMSPATSGTSYFGTRIIGNNNLSSHASESGDHITGMVSATTSSTTSPTIGVNFPINQMEFAQDFTFDNLESFS